MTRLETLKAAVEAHCGDKLTEVRLAGGEITAIVSPENLREVALRLRDTPALRLEQRQLRDLVRSRDHLSHRRGRHRTPAPRSVKKTQRPR